MRYHFFAVTILLSLVDFLLILILREEKGVGRNLHGQFIVLVMDSCLV